MEVRTYTGFMFIVDDPDWESEFELQLPRGQVWKGRPCDRPWSINKRPHTNYVVSSRVILHRLLMQARPGQIVDHIDNNGLNNSRSNLRIVTASQNSRNHKPNRGCPFKGIYLHAKDNRWRANILVDGKRKHLGCFATAEEAAAAYDQAAIEHFGEFAVLNFGLPSVATEEKP